MKPRFVGILSLITLILVALWAGLLIWQVAGGPPVETLEQALTYARDPGWTYTLVYANAVLFTLAATALFAALYVYYRPSAPAWSAVGIVFIPVYCALNVFVYASQITIVPRWQELQSLPGTDAAVAFFLAQMVQAWPGSAVSILNGLAYAILAIPSLIFGLLLCRGSVLLRAAGILLVLSAIASLACALGTVAGLSAQGAGTVAGGLLFLLALIPLTIGFLRREE